MKREMSGWKTEQTNMMPLHRRRKTERTAMTTLKFVVLDPVSHDEQSEGIKAGNEQLAPR